MFLCGKKDAKQLIITLPDSVQSVIKINEENKTYNSPAYQNAVNIYYDHFLSINKNSSPDKDLTGKNFGAKTYETMWGPSEFAATGNLKNYDRAPDLHKINVPVLFVCGEFDEAVPSTVKYFASLVPGAKFEMVKNAAHLTMIDQPEENNRIIRLFLQAADKQ